jgi:sugar phosphate permease
MFMNQPIPSNSWWQPRYTVLFLMWLVYGCFYLNKLNLAPVIPLIIEDLGISHTRVGLVSAAFFFFYSTSQFFWGYLSDILGPRKIVTFGGSISVLANIFFSLGTSSFNLIGAQSLNGLGQGSGWGPSVKLLNNWFPTSERGRTLGIYATCVSIFTILAYWLAGYIGKTIGWRAAFRVSPVILLIVLLVYWLAVRDYPMGPRGRNLESHPSNSNKNLPPKQKRFSTVILDKYFLLASVAFACLTYISYANMVWIPSYLYESHGLNVVKAGFLASLYPAIGILSRPLGGHLSDVTFGGRRKPLILIGFFFILLSTLFLVNAAHLGWAMTLIISVGFFDQLIVTLFFALLVDILPAELTGTGASAMNAIGHGGSTGAMFFSGLLIDKFYSYKPVFLVLSILAGVGILTMLFIKERKVNHSFF